MLVAPPWRWYTTDITLKSGYSKNFHIYSKMTIPTDWVTAPSPSSAHSGSRGISVVNNKNCCTDSACRDLWMPGHNSFWNFEIGCPATPLIAVHQCYFLIRCPSQYRDPVPRATAITASPSARHCVHLNMTRSRVRFRTEAKKKILDMVSLVDPT